MSTGGAASAGEAVTAGGLRLGPGLVLPLEVVKRHPYQAVPGVDPNADR